MSDAAPIELAGMFLEWQRIEDAKAELAEQSKELFKVAKDKGYDTKAMRAVFREKRVELEASPEDVAKAEEAEAKNDLYRSALDRGLTARARPAHDAREIIEEFPSENLSYSQSGLSYAGEKGRGFVAKLTDEQMAAALAYDGEDSPVGELTDNQESEPCLGHATEHSAYVGTAPDENPAQDGVGATASSIHSPAELLPSEAITAGEAAQAPQAQASPAAHSDDEPFEPVAFLRQQNPLRPNCLHPDNCAGYGAKHCYSCRSAQAEAEVA